jgi:hypothetical protein
VQRDRFHRSVAHGNAAAAHGGNRYRRAIQKRRHMFGGVTNDSGVFHQAEEIELAYFGRCSATARVAPSAAGMWFAGYEYLFDSGGGCFPSVADREAYPTRDHAIRAITDASVLSFSAPRRSAAIPRTFERKRKKCSRCSRHGSIRPRNSTSLLKNHQNRKTGDNHEYFDRPYATVTALSDIRQETATAL